MLEGFRDFISRGNVVELAVAVVIGTAFTALVSSLVADLRDSQESPTTRDCPECLSEIPVAARRCAHCTASLAQT